MKAEIMTKYRCESVDDISTGRVFIEVYYPENATQVFRASPPDFATHEEAQDAFTRIATAVLPDFNLLPADPSNSGNVLGFGVINPSPWHFGGIYSDEKDARKIAKKLGAHYDVHYGSHRLDSDDFIYGAL